jgi:hypothetical protein
VIYIYHTTEYIVVIPYLLNKIFQIYIAQNTDIYSMYSIYVGNIPYSKIILLINIYGDEKPILLLNILHDENPKYIVVIPYLCNKIVQIYIAPNVRYI